MKPRLQASSEMHTGVSVPNRQLWWVGYFVWSAHCLGLAGYLRDSIWQGRGKILTQRMGEYQSFKIQPM